MSIFSSLYIGMSGMRVNETGFQAVGDNIANMNTVGFKGSRAVFADVLNRTVLGTAGVSEMGQGAAVQGVQRLHTQGALLQTGITTDLAIGGNGFFLVHGEAAGGEGTFYTRNGQFLIDSDGLLVNTAGLQLQGYTADDNGVLGTALGDLAVGNQTSPPSATSEVGLAVNLDPNEAVNTFDPADLEGTASFSTTVTVYDSLGNAHQVDVYFTNNDNGSWEWHAFAEGDELEGGAPGPTEIAAGSVSFNTDGELDTEVGNSFNVTFAGATAQGVTLDFGESLTTDGGDGSGSSSFAGGSAIHFVAQDGFAAGNLTFLTVDPDGTIQGSFSNGDTRVLGQVALANFNAPQELDSVGGNLFRLGPGAGEPVVGAANTGGRGQIISGGLEQSNVDLTNEFTQMIVTQRGYQAASRTITTANAMLGELVNLIR